MLSLKEVTKQYDQNTPVLSGVNLEIAAGESFALVGESGCGKSTLLNLIGTLDRPDSGSIHCGEIDLLALNEKQIAEFRNRQIGFVFQLHHLLPQCTILENVLVPALVNKEARGAEEWALCLLERVGLSHRLSHRPGQLSGGERQRVAVVRALINHPKMLLADEPTGSLSRAGSDDLLQILLDLNREENLTLILVTHSERLAGRLDRQMTLENGTLHS